MKKLSFILYILSVNIFALDSNELSQMISKAALAKGKDYLKTRTTITNMGDKILPELALLAVDENKTWQERLVSRICYEKIARKDDIDALRKYDWKSDPKYDKRWEAYITGPGMVMGRVAYPKFNEMGLWYYYIELLWKKTGEKAINPSSRSINEEWPKWGIIALTGTTKPDPKKINSALVLGYYSSEPPKFIEIPQKPECYWLVHAICERLLKAKFDDPPVFADRYLYNYLIEHKVANAVPVLVEKFDEYSKEDTTGAEVYPGRNSEIHQGMFEPILSFADSRHVKLLEKFIADHPKLTEEKKVAVEDMEPEKEDEKVVTETRAEILKKKLDEVRKRPAPESKPEPPFRLGDKLVPIPEKTEEK